MHLRTTILSIISLLIVSTSFAKEDIDIFLKELDQELKLVEEYDRLKEERISKLRACLHKPVSLNERHDIYFQLFKEYESYIYDSAILYVQRHYELALKEGHKDWINECKMQLARMHSTFARFVESIEILNSINREELDIVQKGAYYNSYAEVYTYWSEYNADDNILDYLALRDTYRDSAVLVIEKNTYNYDINYGRNCIDARRFNEAEKHLLPHLPDVDPSTRDYAILTSIIAYYYEIKGDSENQKKFLALSAIADIKGSIKENTSLGNLAYLLLNDGDIQRANIYIKKSMEDANFYNARLRNIQVSKILPIIDKAYQIEREKHQKKLQLMVFIIGFLFLIVVASSIFLYRQMKKLAKTRREVIVANRELKSMNQYLSETNHIKEEYIGRFLNQCSIYIDKLESYRKTLNKKASSRQLDELYSMLKSTQIIEDELKEFYQSFDSTFLNLFPDFVDQFNALLPKEDQIVPKNEISLTIELRIFALIRLGITDSDKIANFLRYSITTIYNYRSKYRKKAIIPREIFEETVMKIGTQGKG